MAHLAKRTSSRCLFKEGVAIKSDRGLDYASAENLSSKGILLYCDAGYEAGQQVILDFTLRGLKGRLPVVARAEVLRSEKSSSGAYLVAMKFQQISSEALQGIDSFVRVKSSTTSA